MRKDGTMQAPGAFADMTALRECWHPVAFAGEAATSKLERLRAILAKISSIGVADGTIMAKWISQFVLTSVWKKQKVSGMRD